MAWTIDRWYVDSVAVCDFGGPPLRARQQQL